MTLQRAVGTAVGVSAVLPTTQTAAAYALLTYVVVGFVQEVPAMRGTHDVATFDNLTTGTETKLADMLRAGSGTIMVGLSDTDVGQAALETAFGTKVALRFTLSGGKVYYRNAVVTTFNPTNISVGGFVMAEVGLEFEGMTVKV